MGRLTVDPGSAENGAIYYNTTDNAFRGYRNDAWTNLGIGWATSSANLYNTNSGNVGIGTAVLSYPFEVAKDGSVASGNWVNVASIRDSARNKGLGFGYDSSSQTAIITAFSSSAASNLAFWTYDSSAWGERVRITGAGNVGIGTEGPTNKLQVNGDVIRFERQNIALDTLDFNMMSDTIPRIITNGHLGFITGTGKSYRFDIGAGNEVMRITAAGNVGIGTNDPGTAKLAVIGGNVGIGMMSPTYQLQLSTDSAAKPFNKYLDCRF